MTLARLGYISGTTTRSGLVNCSGGLDTAMLGTVVVAPSTPPRDVALGPSKSGDYASKAKDNLTSKEY